MAAASFPDGVLAPIVLKPDTLTLATGTQYALLSYTGTVTGAVGSAAGGAFVAPVGFYFAPTIKYPTAQFLTVAPAFYAAPTFQPLTTSTDLASIFAGFIARPVWAPLTGGGAPVTPMLAGYYGEVTGSIAGTGTGTITELCVFLARGATGKSMNVGAGITAGLGTGLHVGDGTGTGTITTLVGVEIDALTKGTTNCSIRSAGTGAEMRHVGSAVFGGANINATRTNASVALEVQSTTQALLLSRMTTTQRDTLTTAAIADGMILYNTTTATVQARVAGAWVSL